MGHDGWVRVRWASGLVNSYRMGKEDKYDLCLAPSELAPKVQVEEHKEELADTEISEGSVETVLVAPPLSLAPPLNLAPLLNRAPPLNLALPLT